MTGFLIILLPLLFIFRFHLEISKINPHLQFVKVVRQLTNPLVLPLKKWLPFKIQRIAAIIVAYLFAVLMFLAFARDLSILKIFVNALIYLVNWWLKCLNYGMFFYMVTSFIKVPALQKAGYFIHLFFEPLLAPIRRFMPPIGPIDLSPLIFLFGASVLLNAFANLVSKIL